MTLEPTPQLRWLSAPHHQNIFHPSALMPYPLAEPRTLQQWWRDVLTGEGEWRDVPLEAE